MERVKRMVAFVGSQLHAGSEAAAADSFISRVVAEATVFKSTEKSTHDPKLAYELHRRIRANKDTLFLLIVDEAHSWSGVAGKSAYDKFVNGPFDADGPMRLAENAITLFVSATPYNLQTGNSQVPVDNEHDMLGEDEPGGVSYYGLNKYV